MKRALKFSLLALWCALSMAGCSLARGDAAPETAAPLTLAEAPDRFYDHDGVRLRYRIVGEGEPVILLHGYTDRVEMWSVMADSLAADFKVIVPDLRGFGLSTKFGDPADYGQNLVSDIVGLLDHLAIESVHVVGYSMGGTIAAHLALDDPARFPTVTFVAPGIWKDSLTAARDLDPYIDALARTGDVGPFFRWVLPTWSDSLLNTLLPVVYATNDSASLYASLAALPGLMPDSVRIVRSRVPALVVVGLPDRMLGPSRYTASVWPGAKLIELPKWDHGDIFNAPELIAGFRRLALEHE
jgi:pimeloyl-ACP methyl ester carboxylesterase